MRTSGLVLLLAVLAADPALGASKKAKSSSSSKSPRRYGVLATGPSAAVAGKAAVSALKGVTVPDNRLQEEAQKYGVALGTDPAYQALALGMKLDAVVRVTTLDKGTSQLAVVQVRDGAPWSPGASAGIVASAAWTASAPAPWGWPPSRWRRPRWSPSPRREPGPPRAGTCPCPGW